MNWANIGKKLVAAKKAGKNLNKVDLGKYEPLAQEKRKGLAKVLKKKRTETWGYTRDRIYGGKEGKKQLKAMSRHPEKYNLYYGESGDRKKLGVRKTTKRSYKEGGKVAKRKR